MRRYGVLDRCYFLRSAFELFHLSSLDTHGYLGLTCAGLQGTCAVMGAEISGFRPSIGLEGAALLPYYLPNLLPTSLPTYITTLPSNFFLKRVPQYRESFVNLAEQIFCDDHSPYCVRRNYNFLPTYHEFHALPRKYLYIHSISTTPIPKNP